MNILITGAFGFVGTNLSKSFKVESKHHLTAIDVTEPLTHSYDKFYMWNELEKIEWNSIDVVIHLAGKAHDTKNTTEENAYIDINVGLTKKIFDYLLISNAKKFIFFSSVKAVADSVKGEFLSENEVPHPGTAYGRSKLEAEKCLFERLNEWRENETAEKEKNVYILRPCMIHGPGNKGNLNLLYKLVSKGIPWPLGKFENNRSFTSIDNLSFVISNIIEKDIEPGTYNISDDSPLSTNRLIKLIAESKEIKSRIMNISIRFISLCAKLGDIAHLPLNSERLKKLTDSYVVSNIKLKNALGIKKMPFDSEEEMRKTLASFK